MSRPMQGLQLACAAGLLSGRPAAAALLPAMRGGRMNHSQGTPTVCVDWPETWLDAAGRSCADYAGERLCTLDGLYGPGWNQNWGAFRNYGNAGQTALAACCACGGGYHSYRSTCSYMPCPDGFRVKENAWRIYCKDIDCTLDADVWTCCDAHPEVQLVVDAVQNLTTELKEQVRKEVRARGAEEAERLREVTTGKAEEMGRDFVNETELLQAQALKAAQEGFAARTQHHESMRDAAKYQIEMSGYVAARDAEEGRVDTGMLQARVRQASSEFARAAQVWQQTDAVSHKIVSKGHREWENYYKDLNDTWPEILRGIESVNSAVAESIVPQQAVRWSEQAVRLSSDVAQVVDGQMSGIEAQVAQAEERAAEARRATQTNKGRIVSLKAMVGGIGR